MGDMECGGLGVNQTAGAHLKLEYQRFDAVAHFRPAPQQVYDDPRARCGAERKWAAASKR